MGAKGTYGVAALAGMMAMAGCTPVAPTPAPAPTNVSGSVAAQASYGGVETRLLDGALVNFLVSYKGPQGAEKVAAYAQCAAAQYTQIRGFGFAQHVRTKVSQEAGIWRADAVYTISSALPDGLRKLDAEVVLANCRDNGIPTV